MAATPSAQPSSLIAKLARPTAAYKRRAWLAMAGLALFVVLYFALAGWFALTAWRLTFGADSGGKDVFWGFIVGGCAAFLAVFMLKAVFFVKHGGMDDTVEITAQQQPRLFEFLHRLADKAGAPRPHKVFLSPRVNAAVFYDLSILNLFWPSKKNLEIGLGLVNALSLGELRAVLAHEFGHFAQRAMAVGRWVYVAQQIAAHLVARRDRLDDFLRALSRFDVRVAWVGWLLSLIVWSIRSLVDSAFSVVVLTQRALSREMEMQADLVAVSLTGSDALIHALHRLQSADDAWSRALGFVAAEKAKGQVTRDVFAIQSEVLARMGRILNDASYGRVPPLPAERPEAHRLFKAELAQPPQMWLTHPLNHEREANAKRHYIVAPIDERSAWDLFDAPALLREQVSAKLLGKVESAPVADEASLAALQKQFEREYLASRYRGVYLGRSVVRSAQAPQQLVGNATAEPLAAAQQLYPESLAADVELLRSLEKELGQLRALKAGALSAPGGVLRHRGKALKRPELPQAIAAIEAEVAAVEARLAAHDRLCRSVHRAAAAQLGNGWPEHLRGLLEVLHYADHSEANLRDAQGLLANAVNVVTATRRVNSSGVTRVVNTANALQQALAKLFDQRHQVVLDAALFERLAAPSWAEALGELKLPPATPANISEWLNAANGWVDHAAGACAALRMHALEQLLLSEASVIAQLRQGASAPAAPAAARVPADYDTLLPGQERERQTRLGWWARFQTADGALPAIARLLVAAGIVGAVLGLGGSVGSATLTVYNGLARPVRVSLGGSTLDVAPFTSQSRSVDADRSIRIETRTPQGELVERFDAEVRGSFGNVVYNVAGAAPLVEWTATYGNGQPRAPRPLGAPRWTTTSAEHLFSEPPRSISSKGGGGTREALASLADASASQQLAELKNGAEQTRLILTHARWDATASAHALEWLTLAAGLPEAQKILAARLRESPDDLVLLRMEQDSASDSERPSVCARHQARADAAPTSPDWRYLAARCLASDAAKAQAFVDGHRQWPQHGWLAYAAGYSEAEAAHWFEAIAALDQARRSVPALAAAVSVDVARIRRLVGEDAAPAMGELAKVSEPLRFMLSLEKGAGLESPELRAYAELARGQWANALKTVRAAPEREARLLRLAAASDGASDDAIARAFALAPDAGIDASTLWPTLGLALRLQRDTAPFLPLLKGMRAEHAERMQGFIEQLKSQDLVAAMRLLDGLPPELRGQAC
ncbi:M48 family metallopeptidase, partial [Piscinibacter sp.]|uniref:M48 family metallopeptidase n=1 Tax=Piscinibacter sp. TaxID=1903157 RepID=UPI002F40F816